MSVQGMNLISLLSNLAAASAPDCFAVATALACCMHLNLPLRELRGWPSRALCALPSFPLLRSFPPPPPLPGLLLPPNNL